MTIALILSSAISFDSSSVRAATPKLSKTVISLFSGKSTTLKVSGTDKAVKWSSSDKNIASVSKKGKVTGKNAGKAIITATIGKQTLQCKVTVKAILSMTTDYSNDNNVPIDTDHSNDNNVPIDSDSDTDSGSHLLF